MIDSLASWRRVFARMRRTSSTIVAVRATGRPQYAIVKHTTHCGSCQALALVPFIVAIMTIANAMSAAMEHTTATATRIRSMIGELLREGTESV